LTAKAEANRIHFKPGAEVARTDSLHYSQAYVDLKLNSNQWYMISAPLQELYVGDIYETDPNPIRDGYLIEPMYFNAPNPQTMQTALYNWTGRFHNADELLTTGKGLAVWTDKRGTPYTNHDPVTFAFPKHDTFYNYYDYAGSNITDKTPTLTRTDKRYRFIYEQTIASNGYVPLNGSPCADTKQPVLVGNPFMAHLDMDQFLADNTGIYDEYRIAYDVSAADGVMKPFVTFRKVLGDWFTTDPEDASLSNLIAPMQSFIVTSKEATPTLRANIKSTTTATSLNDRLRASQAEQPSMPVLDIRATREESKSKTLLLWMAQASNTYHPEEDSYKLFLVNDETEDPLFPVQVYTRSSDGYALEINAIGNTEEVVPLGICTSDPGEITLHFSGMEAFGNTKIHLHDTQKNLILDLSLQNEYTFDKNDAAFYLEDRFFLTFQSPTGMETAVKSPVSIISFNGIDILSKDGSPIRNVRITDMQGQSLIQEDRLAVSGYHYPAKAGMYIVRVGTDQGMETYKVIVK
jgi:hypothetical protein